MPAYRRAMTTAMTTVAALDADVVDVDPGAESSCALELRNNGDVVESYELEVLGDAAAWTVLEPPTVSVYPGDAVRIAVRFRPSRDGRVPAGEVPFGIQVTPSLYPEAAVVPEGVVRVSPYTSTTAEIRPHTSAARRTGRHLVAVDNRGNVELAMVVSGTDPDDAVKVTGRPATLAIGPGQAAFAKVRVRHRRRLWRGQPVTRPFQVFLTPKEHAASQGDEEQQRYEAGDAPVVLDATSLQLPVIPRGAGKLVAALVALALLAAGLWFGVLRPAVEAAAREAAEDAVQEPMSEVAAEAGLAAEAAEQAQIAADALAAQPAPPATPAPGTETVASDGAGVQRHRFETVVATGATVTSDPLTAPEDASLAITDLLLQNPQGDTGRLDILVDGVAVHTEALQNFRSVDYHFVTPIEVPAGESIALRTSCVTPGPALAQTSGSSCRVFVLAVGFAQPVASPAPNPVTAP
jgi:hypothetical protein